VDLAHCDEVNDVCVDCATDEECDNGEYCDGEETCVDGSCQPGTAVDCDDSVGCTDDSCNEGTDSCDNIPNNTNCDNGEWCDGAETCDASLDCQAGTAPDCDDEVGCTDDSCNEATDSCDNIPNNANCDNGDWCDGAETCDASLDCQAGTPPDCDDGDPCTDDSCDEVNDVCVNADATYIDVFLEIEALTNAVTRDVTLIITDCEGSTDTRVEPVDFDVSGTGSVRLTEVNIEAEWIQATEGHALSRTLPLTFSGADGCSAWVSFMGDDRLMAGDYSNAWVPQDNLVDIQDYAILSIEWNQPVDPNLGTLADASGDGVQDAEDFTPIQANFAEIGDDADGCARGGTTLARLGYVGKTRMTVAELNHRDAHYADMNADGIIDLKDIRAFAAYHELVLTAEFDAKLRRLEAAQEDIKPWRSTGR
jgi:hypothetical protein